MGIKSTRKIVHLTPFKLVLLINFNIIAKRKVRRIFRDQNGFAAWGDGRDSGGFRVSGSTISKVPPTLFSLRSFAYAIVSKKQAWKEQAGRSVCRGCTTRQTLRAGRVNPAGFIRAANYSCASWPLRQMHNCQTNIILSKQDLVDILVDLANLVTKY